MASTVPASARSVEKSKSSSSSPAVVTPEPTAKAKGVESTDGGSAPKLSRVIQSKQVLDQPAKRGRSPTVRYSPDDEDDDDDEQDEHGQVDKPEKPVEPPPPKKRQTAVKAKAAAPKAEDVGKAPGSAEAKSEPKETTPDSSEAVLATLHRKCTVEIQKNNGKANSGEKSVPKPTPPLPPPSPSLSTSDEEEPQKPEEKRMTVEQVQARKAAHARYMRFSRSIKSKRFLPYTIMLQSYSL